MLNTAIVMTTRYSKLRSKNAYKIPYWFQHFFAMYIDIINFNDFEKSKYHFSEYFVNSMCDRGLNNVTDKSTARMSCSVHVYIDFISLAGNKLSKIVFSLYLNNRNDICQGVLTGLMCIEYIQKCEPNKKQCKNNIFFQSLWRSCQLWNWYNNLGYDWLVQFGWAGLTVYANTLPLHFIFPCRLLLCVGFEVGAIVGKCIR